MVSSVYSSYHILDKKFQPEYVPLNKAFCWDYTTIPSDSDTYKHIGHAVYIRLCFDYGILALQAKRLHKFKKDNLAQYCVKSFNAFYNSEAKCGEKFSVFGWKVNQK